uniref:Lipocalin/cytosolic fatty-acid binding domain-containing protein n=1 Tax=Knipowitschia caucasica TaxID=637954 RepID=A0AAV2KQQ6_KNICA
MKAVCAVLCALLYVCRAAPLTCDQLTSPGQVQDLTGTWFVHAMSTDSCVLRNSVQTLLSPSLIMDITEDTQQYQAVLMIKTLSICENETLATLTPQRGMLVAQNGRDTYKLFRLTNSSDCVVFKMEMQFANTTVLYFSSRRKSVEPAEILEFETQASCLHLPRPERLGSDFDFSSCREYEETELTEAEAAVLLQRLRAWAVEVTKCLMDYMLRWYKFS